MTTMIMTIHCNFEDYDNHDDPYCAKLLNSGVNIITSFLYDYDDDDDKNDDDNDEDYDDYDELCQTVQQ